jgi:predicted CoA-binding protein
VIGSWHHPLRKEGYDYLMSKVITSDSQLAELLSKTKRVAIVGISEKEDRPSNGVSRWLQKNSHFELYFVNPALTSVLDQPCYASLADIPVKIDLVDIFRKVSDIPSVVDEAIAIGAQSIWIQLGLVDEESAERAIAAGLDVAMDHCIKVEYERLAGSISPQE